MLKKVWDRLHVRQAFLAPILVAAVAVATLNGCGDDKPTSATQELPDVQGAVVPQTIEEGTPVEVEIWGRTPDESWILTGFDVQSGSEDVVTITPRGRRSGQMTGRPGSFRGTATISSPGSGPHTVRIAGGMGSMDFPMDVFPRNALANLMVHGAGGVGHEQLVIGADGWAFAMRMGDGPAVRVQLSAAAVDSVRGFFREAGFMNLDSRYVGNSPINDLFYEVSFHPDLGTVKWVVAEDRRAPDVLKLLVQRLRGMLDRILQDGSVPPAVVASISVDPASGDPGSTRVITLSLENRSTSPTTVHFATAQIYDVAIMGMQGMDGDMGHMGDGDMGGMHGSGGMNGMGPGDHDPGDSHLVWNWGYGRDFTAVPTELTLQAGEIDTFQVTWPGTTNAGAVADTGLYRVAAMILSRPMVPTRPAELVVGAAAPPSGPLVLTCTVQPQSGPASTRREMHLTVENPTDQTITLHFRDGQLYDFYIFDPMGMRPGPMWMWSQGRGFDPAPAIRTIQPHDRIEFVEYWDCVDFSGMRVHPGWFDIGAVLPASDVRRSDRVRTEVTRE